MKDEKITERMSIEEMKEIVKKDPAILQALPEFHRKVLIALTGENPTGVGQGAEVAGGKKLPPR